MLKWQWRCSVLEGVLCEQFSNEIQCVHLSLSPIWQEKKCPSCPVLQTQVSVLSYHHVWWFSLIYHHRRLELWIVSSCLSVTSICTLVWCKLGLFHTRTGKLSGGVLDCPRGGTSWRPTRPLCAVSHHSRKSFIPQWAEPPMLSAVWPAVCRESSCPTQECVGEA